MIVAVQQMLFYVIEYRLTVAKELLDYADYWLPSMVDWLHIILLF